MHDVIDIYTKLIIAIISFIAPLIVHLLSMFSDALAHIRRRGDIELRQINELIRKQIRDDDASSIQELIKKSNNYYKEREERIKKQQNLLDPKRQIKRIFPTLFCALIFLALYILVENFKWFGDYNIYVLIILMLFSLACATTGVVFLKCIAWTVIDIKQQLAEDQDKKVELSVIEKN